MRFSPPPGTGCFPVRQDCIARPRSGHISIDKCCNILCTTPSGSKKSANTRSYKYAIPSGFRSAVRLPQGRMPYAPTYGQRRPHPVSPPPRPLERGPGGEVI
jgi:hypothetical protein